MITKIVVIMLLFSVPLALVYLVIMSIKESIKLTRIKNKEDREWLDSIVDIHEIEVTPRSVRRNNLRYSD